MTDFLKTFSIVYSLFAIALLAFSLVATSPAVYAVGDSMDAAAGNIAGFIAEAMDVNGDNDDE